MIDNVFIIPAVGLGGVVAAAVVSRILFKGRKVRNLRVNYNFTPADADRIRGSGVITDEECERVKNVILASDAVSISDPGAYTGGFEVLPLKSQDRAEEGTEP